MPLDAALELVRQGQKVIIPEGANLPDVIQYLVARMEDEETTVDINEQFHCHPIDGAISLSKAILEMFGDPNTTTMTVEGMFGPREQRPAVLSVNISPTETMQVLWGGFTIPQIDGKLQCGVGGRYPSITFVMNGKVKKKSLHLVKALADRARAIAKEQSIYRSKSFILPVDDDGNVNAMETKFFDVSGISKGDLIFNEELMANLQANIWTPLEASASCKAHGIKLKRGIMLAGSYGTGKTLTARVTANVANDAGWTFILVQRSTGLAAAIEFARMYAPCVIFAEDIDRAVAGAERTVDIDDVLNIIDGIQTKSEDIMTVLTSNHVERINRAMLRPGRIDALIDRKSVV